ncbi:hypothetical protein [Frankia sp. KB5]|uniref:hypothetical protein n=1 Tax=Frankia sp. KB5 TaxID=683318 RepID=UPI000A107E19|nr:hypothetical protein [Frankia sp. KB5]ORT46687.1 hypothetical protein KBI5_23845 [Frankia sp. KB5]
MEHAEGWIVAATADLGPRAEAAFGPTVTAGAALNATLAALATTPPAPTTATWPRRRPALI